MTVFSYPALIALIGAAFVLGAVGAFLRPLPARLCALAGLALHLPIVLLLFFYGCPLAECLTVFLADAFVYLCPRYLRFRFSRAGQRDVCAQMTDERAGQEDVSAQTTDEHAGQEDVCAQTTDERTGEEDET